MEHGITDSNEQQAEVRHLAIKRANEVYLVVDYTKFNKTSFTHICDFNEINAIVVDTKLDENWHNFLSEQNITIVESN